MKVIVVSDTHGRDINFKKVVEMHNPDMVVLNGDINANAKGYEYLASVILRNHGGQM